MQRHTVNDLVFSYNANEVNMTLPTRKLNDSDLAIINSTMDLLNALRTPRQIEPLPPMALPGCRELFSAQLVQSIMPAHQPKKRTAADVLAHSPYVFSMKGTGLLAVDYRGQDGSEFARYFCFAYRGERLCTDHFKSIKYVAVQGTTRGDTHCVFIERKVIRRENVSNVFVEYNMASGLRIKPDPAFEGSAAIAILPCPLMKQNRAVCVGVDVYRVIVEDREAGASAYWVWPQ